MLYEGVYRLLDGQLAWPDLVVYIRARVEVVAERLASASSSAISGTEYLESVPRVPRLVFYYDETPLLMVDSSESDFVHDPGDLEDLLRKIDRTVTGSHPAFSAMPGKSSRKTIPNAALCLMIVSSIQWSTFT